MIGKVYLGDIDFLGQRGDIIANYENGLVYSGDIDIFGIRGEIVANYKKGLIYDGDISLLGDRNAVIANYDSEKLYWGDVGFFGFRDRVLATYDGERIYEGDMDIFGQRGDVIATYEGAPDGALAAIAAIVLRLSSRCSPESVSQQNFYQDVKEDNGVFGFIGEVFSFWWMIIKACGWILKAALWIVFFIVKWIKRKRTLPENSGCTGKKQTGQKQIIISAKASGESSDTCKKRRKKRRKRRKPKLGVILALILCLSLAFFAVSIRVAYPPSEHKTRPGTFVVAGALDSWSLVDLSYTQNFDTDTLNQMN